MGSRSSTGQGKQDAASPATELTSIRDKRAHSKENEADSTVISGKWVLKPRKARFVLSGFEEDVKDEDVFASTNMTASVRMLLSQATDLRNEDYTLFTADRKIALLDGETLDSSKGTVIWKPQKSLCYLRRAPRRCQNYLERILRTCGFVPNMLDTCLWTRTTKRAPLIFHVDDLLLAGMHQIIKEVLTGLSRDLELKSSEVTAKPTRYL